ncbi:MAG TPA: ComEC/Rec2 family competence protein [Acidobacteriaceae bacterium]
MSVEPLRLRRAPLLAAAVCFALGESLTLLPQAPRPAVLLAVILALLAFTLFALRRKPRLALLCDAALWIVIGLLSARIEPAPAPQAALLSYADGLSRTVEARIVRIRELPPRTAHDGRDGDADSDPDQWDDDGPPTLSIDLALTAIEDVTPGTSSMVPIAGGVRALLLEPRSHGQQAASLQSRPPFTLPRLHCGDAIEVPIRLRIPERYRDPGAWQYADLLLDQGIAATGSIRIQQLRSDDYATQRSRPAAAIVALRCRIFAAQSWAAARLPEFVHSKANRSLPAAVRLTPDDAGMLNAMLFGDRSRLTHTLRLGFERTASFHLFVVSGMHVALLAALVFWSARRLRLGEIATTSVTLALSSAYALLTGFGVPVQRALLMTAVFLLARLLARDRNVLNALGAAALAVLVGSPRALFDASFQMTFLAIVAIAGIAVPVGERSIVPSARAARRLQDRWRDAAMPPRLAQLRVMLRLWGEALAGVFGKRAYLLPSILLRTVLRAAELALIGVAAEAVMALPMAVYFHRATVFALPANMLSVPLVAVLAPLAMLTFLASLASSWFAVLPSATLALLLHAITGAIHRLSRAQAADVRVPGPTLAHTAAALLVLAFCCWAVRRSRALAIAAIAALPLVPLAALWPSAPAVHRGQLEVTAIDVGQGDSLFIVSPNGRAMLIDAGGPTGAAANAENATGPSTFDIGEQVVSPYLWSRQLRRLDILVLTHAHSDHMGGMPAVLRNFRPRELWVAIDPYSASYRELLAEAAALGIRVRHLRAGDHIDWDSVAVNVLAPSHAYANSGPPVNDDSLVLHMQFGKASALLEGDAQAASEDAMVDLARAGDAVARIGPVTLLKVAHHGSRTSTTPEFLALAAPQDAVISVGENNTFGHPRAEVLDRLAGAHAHVYRTDRDGLATFLLSPDGRIAAIPFASNP